MKTPLTKPRDNGSHILETFEIFRGPTNQDGSTQEFITLPLDMVKKLLAGAEDSAALKKKVERLESEATEVRIFALIMFWGSK